LKGERGSRREGYFLGVLPFFWSQRRSCSSLVSSGIVRWWSIVCVTFIRV